MGSEATQFKKGTVGNPGGFTAEERQARDAIRKALMAPDMMREGLAAYRRLLEADNPMIAKDFMDRLAGKPREHIELSQDPDAPLNPLAPLTLDELKAVARAQLDKERK